MKTVVLFDQQVTRFVFCLFDLMLYVHSKQRRSYRDSHLLNHTVPGQISQFTSTYCNLVVSPVTDILLFLNQQKREQYEPRHEKTNVLQMRKTKKQISFAVTAKLVSAFVFAT